MSDALRRIGRDVVGPALVLQLRYALDVQEDVPLDRVCFCDERGAVLRTLYDRLAVGRRAAPSRLVSIGVTPRRLGLPAFRASAAGVPVSLGEVLTAYGLDDPEVRAIVDRVGYGDPTRPVDAPWQDRALHGLLDDAAFVAAVAERGQARRDALLRQIDAPSGGRLGFVGFGLDTRLEETLTESVAPELAVALGVYLALLPKREPTDAPPERRLGVLFDYRRPWGTAESAVTQLAWLFDAACAASGDPALHAGVLDAADRPASGRVHLLDERPTVVQAIERLAYFPTAEEARALSALEARRSDVSPRDPLRERLGRVWKSGLLARVGGRPLCEAYYRYQRLRVARTRAR